jgi:hypothetical protein
MPSHLSFNVQFIANLTKFSSKKYIYTYVSLTKAQYIITDLHMSC